MTDRLERLLGEAREGAVLRDGVNVVIAGPPNAGKSSLMNRLAGYDAAIVTHVPGTTRDPLRENLSVDGLPVCLTDTAGFRAAADPVEVEGVRRARRAVERADRVLWLLDVREDLRAGMVRRPGRGGGPRGADRDPEQGGPRGRRAGPGRTRRTHGHPSFGPDR